MSFACKAMRHGTIDHFPVKTQKKDRKLEDRTILVIQDGEKTAIRRRPSRGLLAGLYEFPNVSGHLSKEETLEMIREMNLDPLYIEPLPDAKHIFSHIEWRMTAYRVRVSSLEDNNRQTCFLSAGSSQTDNMRFHQHSVHTRDISNKSRGKPQRRNTDENFKYCNSVL